MEWGSTYFGIINIALHAIIVKFKALIFWGNMDSIVSLSQLTFKKKERVFNKNKWYSKCFHTPNYVIPIFFLSL